jgi:hypothetical protein
MAEDNTHLWKDKVEIVLQVIDRASYTLHAWQQPQNIAAYRQASPWQPPPLTYLKCNIDATIFMSENIVAMGGCLRDEVGVI